jgi:chromosome partitioning protein
VVTVSNQKGGVGKTTTVCNLAAGLKEKGFRVLAVDLDPQGNLGFSVGADMETDASIYHVLKGDVSAKDAIQETQTADIIVSSILLSAIELEFTSTGREYLLKEALASVSCEYDYILLDTPPTLGILTVNAFTASDAVIVPMLSDIFSLQGIAQLYETVERVKKYCNPNLKVSGILLTNYNPRTNLSREIRGTVELVSRDLEVSLFDTFIRKSVLVSEAQSVQRSVLVYAPDNNAATDYRLFTEEFLAKGI